MKKNYLSLIAVLMLGLGGKAVAQLVGTNCYLQGRYVEIGMNNNASFGACNSNGAIPAGYHPHMSGSGIPPAGNNLAEVYDWGHDGWTTGTPPYMGDYTYPGSPFEGWELQIGGGRVQAFQNCGGTMTSSVGGMTMSGSLSGYSNIGGRATGTWTGTATGSGATLAIRQETRVDTLASAVVVTTVLRNTSGTTAPNVYYFRSCDPDNAETWPALGGSFSTTNQVVHQNEDVRHRVLVKAYDNSSSLGELRSYMGLCTRDCRARCLVYTSWYLTSSQDLSALWSGTYGTPGSSAQYTVGACLPPSCNESDIAIGLVYNLGNIAAGDSTVISYGYIYNGDDGIDSAFPDPQIVINGVPHTSYAPPTPNFDTFDVCLYPGMTTLPVDLLNADDKCWSWSNWSWSPAIGLSSTSGVHNTINTLVLPPSITYTITGSDSASGMSSCHNKTFYLTVKTCNGAECNSPCEGDTLWFNAPGDSSVATYQWYGPLPSTTVFGTTQKTFIYPATTANNGMYAVIKTVPGGVDTSFTIATVHHKPTVWASSNAPLCAGGATPLLLNAVCDSPSVSYSWTANPSTFTSASATPTISPFTASDTGIFTVIVSSVFGCSDTDQVHVTLAPVPPAPVVTAVTPYCQYDAFVPFTVSGIVPGATVLWYGSATGGVGTSVTPVVNTSVAGTNTFYFSQKIGSCEGPRDSVTIVVNPVPVPITGTAQLCQYFTTTLTDATASGIWSSSNPSVATIGTGTGVVYGVAGGTATVSYTLPTTCRRTTVVTVHPKPAPPSIPDIRHCQYSVAPPLPTTIGTGLTWYGLGVTPGSAIPPTPNTSVPGTYTYYVTQTSAFGCVSDSAAFPVIIKPQPEEPITRDTTYCQHFDAPALTAIGSNLLWYTTTTSSPGSSAAPVPATEVPGIITYYVTQTVNGCESPRADLNVTTLYVPDFTITADKPWACQFDSIAMHYDGPSLVGAGFNWSLPVGASFVNGTHFNDENVVVKFDTAWGQHVIYLTASTYDGTCFNTEQINIKVIPAPDVNMYIKSDICLGDTISLALANRSDNSYKFTWMVDGVPMGSSTALDIITANSHSAGPYLVSWNDTGLHILNIQGFTEEGCKSLVTADTVKVHQLPDAKFEYEFNPKKPVFCIEDSVLFKARTQNYAWKYTWEPEHSFSNLNTPEVWGRVEQLRAVITLTVTDPFGCYSKYSRQLSPDECCTITIPNAFTPNNDGSNDVFRPLFQGYRRFHIFRVSNRWGQTVFESTSSKPAWDGSYNGVPQDIGVYYYYIKFDCGGKVVEQKGDVTLLR